MCSVQLVFSYFVGLGYYPQLKTSYQKCKTSQQEGTNFDLISCYTTKVRF